MAPRSVTLASARIWPGQGYDTAPPSWIKVTAEGHWPFYDQWGGPETYNYSSDQADAPQKHTVQYFER
jgi:hypothetical protein